MARSGRQGALERGEAAGERCLQLRGEEDPQLRDDASRDQLVRGHIKGRVPHLDTCREGGGEVKQLHGEQGANVWTELSSVSSRSA